MQETKKQKSNRTRAEATRADLIRAARSLFAEKGYADTGTPEIVAAAGMTRGALHHHFTDKVGLFRAVVESEALAVATTISQRVAKPESGLEGILQGADAFFDAMSVPGRSRLLLLEGPAILGVAAMETIDSRTGQSELREGLELAIGRAASKIPLDALTAVLSAAFDKAALAIVLGESVTEYREALRILVLGIPGVAPVSVPRKARSRIKGNLKKRRE